MSINVNKTRKHFSRNIHGARIFPQCFPVSQFPIGKHCCLRYMAGNFNENPSMRACAKILRARASEHSSNFFEQFQQRPNFASTFKLDGTIQCPYYFQISLFVPEILKFLKYANKPIEDLISSTKFHQV